MSASARLNDGNRMPWLGMGVYGLSGDACVRAVKHALSVGYRLFDTAKFYGNEAEVGRAVRDVQRDQVFVTTKLWESDQGYESAVRACNDSLARLGLEYIDLYLIHWPTPVTRLESWRALVDLRKQGRCRSIGVSNFTVAHLTELMAHSEVVPSVNQVEFSPFLYQRELLEFCRGKGIRLEAYGALTRGEKLGDPVVVEIARKHGKTPAQVMLRWAMQHAVVVIPKSAQSARIEEMRDVFDFAIGNADMAALDSRGGAFRASRDPTSVQ